MVFPIRKFGISVILTTVEHHIILSTVKPINPHQHVYKHSHIGTTRVNFDPVYIFTSLAKEVMFLVALVCLSVCLSVNNITQKVMNG